MTDGHLFNNISLGGRGSTRCVEALNPIHTESVNTGQLKVQSGGMLWKKQGGGMAVEVDKDDLVGLIWMKVPGSNQLGVRIKDGLYYKFTGFRDQDVASLTTYFQNCCGISPGEKQLSISGKNWGEVDLNVNMLAFLVGSKQAFEISLADVSQTQLQGKNDVMLEFHVDDTTGANEKDSLMESSFHIPNSNTRFVGDENRPPAQDEDLVLDKDDGGSPTDDSGGDKSDASASGGEEEKHAKKKRKMEATVSKPSMGRKKANDDGSKKKKQKKKEVPNAPKRAMTALMYFSRSEMENVKKNNPGIRFTDVGKVLVEKWSKLSAADKDSFEAMARADEKRYSEQISYYKNPQPTAMDSGNESGSS